MGVLPRIKNLNIQSGKSRSEQQTPSATDDEAGSGRSTPGLVPAAPTAPGMRSSILGAALAPAHLTRNVAYRLRMKQGRKSKRRYENERLLMIMYGIDSDECFEGRDIAKESRSYFGDLLNDENHELLESVLNNEEAKYFNTQEEVEEDNTASNEEPQEQDIQADTAFQRIGHGLRQALKRKNLPLGILERLEDAINDQFLEEPCSEFISDSMSSFERLLVHALSAYYALNSYSYDSNGKRVLKIVNPRKEFHKKDPLLHDYLRNKFSL